MELLSRDMIMEILKRLQIPELLNVCETNKYFNSYRHFFESDINSYFDYKYEKSRSFYYREMNEYKTRYTQFYRFGKIDTKLAKAMSLDMIYINYGILYNWWTLYIIKEYMNDHNYDHFILYGRIDPDAIIITNDFMFSTFPDLPDMITWPDFGEYLSNKIDYSSSYSSSISTIMIHDVIEEMNDLFHYFDREISRRHKSISFPLKVLSPSLHDHRLRS